MKTRIISYVLMVMVFVACEKDNSTEPMTQDQDAKKVIQNNKANNNNSSNCGKFNYRKFEADPNSNAARCSCIRTGNCYADVVVNGLQTEINMINGVFNDIGTGNQSTVQTSFAENRDFLDNYISTEIIDGVVSGNLEVHSAENQQESKKFMLFADEDSDPATNNYYLVIPFNL